MIISIIIILMLGLGGLSFLNYQKTKQILVNNLEQSMISLAESSGREVSLWLDARKAEITLLSNTQVVVGGKQEEFIPYLASEVKRNKVYEMFFVSDKKGNAPTTGGTTADISDRDYFKQVMATGQPVVSDPLVSKASNKLIVVVAAPIIRNGTVDGVMGGTVLVDDLSKKVSSVKVGQTGYAYMVQGDGTFIAHPDRELVMKYNPLKDGKADAGLAEAVKRMVGGETGVARYVFEGVDRYVAFAPVPGVNWYMAATAPAAELSSQLLSLPVTSAVTAMVFVIVIGIISGVVLSRMVGGLKQVSAGAARIARGDLTGDEIAVKSGDELGQLAGAFNSMLATLKEIAGQLQEKSRILSSSSGELSASAENITAGASETASTASQVASTVDQVTSNVRNIAESSARAAGYAEEGSRGIQRITDQMEAIQRAAAASGEVIGGLNESAGKISQIVELITQIAEQTNLLALNAAIEAARAGEQGRGFAVVAEEVRKLAEQSASAAGEINSLISSIQQETREAVRSMQEGAGQVQAGSDVVREVGGTLEKIIEAVRGLASDIQMVADAAGQISSAVENVAAAAEEQTATMEEVSSTTQALAALARELEELAGRFKIR
ncbi:MAG: methyl-accepting chemotaxis protein [Peptococcaceae bacterium]|nr:methyl-accepting chemotaxis protein [Peptococcaceae bacterium]